MSTNYYITSTRIIRRVVRVVSVPAARAAVRQIGGGETRGEHADGGGGAGVFHLEGRQDGD